MAAFSYSDELYDRLTDAFRSYGESWTKVAKACGVDLRTARRAYLLGHRQARHTKFAVPIKVVLDKERAEARAKLAAQSQLPSADQQAARVDAAQQLAETVTLVRNVRKAASTCLGLVGTMVPGALALAKKLTDPATLSKLDGEDAVRVVQRVVRMAQSVSAMAETAQIMEHREAGKPTDILALQGVGSEPESMTLEQAERELSAITAALARAKEVGVAGVETVAVPFPN